MPRSNAGGQTTINICCEYLAEKVYDLQKQVGEVPECSVCIDKILPCCHVLLPCGHQFHMKCVFKVSKCPICRQ